MQPNNTGAGAAPLVTPNSEAGYDQVDRDAGEPVTGETTERQPAWRPSEAPAGQEIYEGTEAEKNSGDAGADERGI